MHPKSILIFLKYECVSIVRNKN